MVADSVAIDLLPPHANGAFGKMIVPTNAQDPRRPRQRPLRARFPYYTHLPSL
jgi:hypothetical protein